MQATTVQAAWITAINSHDKQFDRKIKWTWLPTPSYRSALITCQGTISLDASKALAWIGLGISYRHSRRPNSGTPPFRRLTAPSRRKAQLARLAQKPEK